jgi:hypothetical protein
MRSYCTATAAAPELQQALATVLLQLLRLSCNRRSYCTAAAVAPELQQTFLLYCCSCSARAATGVPTVLLQLLRQSCNRRSYCLESAGQEQQALYAGSTVGTPVAAQAQQLQ